jgi:hypothetical protein
MSTPSENCKRLAALALRIMLGGIFALPGVRFAQAETIVLSSEGTARYRIVVPVSDSNAGRFAAEELKKYLDQMSVSDFEVGTETSGRDILVATVQSLSRIDPHVNISALGDDEFGIFMRGQKLLLTGGSDRSLLYAVYEFLTVVGCRWPAPDFDFFEGKSRMIPAVRELKYSHSSDRTEKPVLKYRKLYIEEGLTHDPENLRILIDWMPKARYNILVAPLNYGGKGRVCWDNWRDSLIPELEKRGILVEVGGHGYQNFLNAGMDNGRLFREHPEWFGLGHDGERQSNPHMVFCTSNRSSMKFLHSSLLDYLKKHPEIDIFDFWPPDSETWCECEKCSSMGTPSERHAILVSQTARCLRKKIPGVKLECIAYHRYVEPPQSKMPDSNVLIDFCPINQSFDYQIYEEGSANNRMYRDHLLSWLKRFGGDISIYSYYRKYAWRSLPVMIPHYMQNDLLFYSSCGVRGISVYSEPGDWFTYGLNHYVLAHLAWNPKTDVDKLITDYCSVLFGPEANLAASVFTGLEEIVRFGCRVPFSQPKSPGQYNGYINRLELFEKEIQTNLHIHRNGEIVNRHLQRLSLMVEYAGLSALYLKDISEKNQEQADKTAENISKLMSENARMGLFIPR